MYMSLLGRPDKILTDNWPQYTGQSFQRFMSDWGVKDVTSSPLYPKSKGFIEMHVRHIKSIKKKKPSENKWGSTGMLIHTLPCVCIRQRQSVDSFWLICSSEQMRKQSFSLLFHLFCALWLCSCVMALCLDFSSTTIFYWWGGATFRTIRNKAYP